MYIQRKKEHLEVPKSPFPAPAVLGEDEAATLADSIASGAACTVPTYIQYIQHIDTELVFCIVRTRNVCITYI